MRTILILGGYGNAGRVITERLLKETDCCIIVAGRNFHAAAKAAADLNRGYCGNRALAAHVDASDPGGLAAKFAGVDLVVTAAPITGLAAGVARAAVNAGADLIDVGIGASKCAELRAFDTLVRDAGRSVIADAGFHPGLPAVLVRYVAGWFDRLEAADVGSVIQIDWRNLAAPISQSTAAEMIDEFRDFCTDSFRDGKWVTLPWKDVLISMDFPAGFGRRPCTSWFLEEMRALPEMIPSLRRTGFYVGGFNWFSDYVMMPVMLAASRLPKGAVTRTVANLFLWSLKAFSKPPYGTLLKVEAEGIAEGRPARAELVVSHNSGYVFTGVPVVACVLQYLNGAARKPGVSLMGHILEPRRLLQDMQRMGIIIEEKRPAQLLSRETESAYSGQATLRV
jgi:saccharopine dehydrogenase (NAD+, L-lysine-forming)